MKKSIFLKLFTCSLLLVALCLSLISCMGPEPDYHHGNKKPLPEREEIELTNEDVLRILSVTAKEYTGLELETVEISRGNTSRKPFFPVDQATFTTLMSPRNISENEILADSSYFFNKAVSSAYLVVSQSKDFKLGNIYDASIVNYEGNILEDNDPCPVGIISAGDGGIFVLYYEDSIINNETIQVTFYLAVENGVAIVESSAVYAGSDIDGVGCMIIDYVQFVAGKSIETASVVFKFDSGEEARRISKLVNDNPKAMNEIKKNVITLDYQYGVFSIVDETEICTANGMSFEKGESGWSDIMNNLYSALYSAIDTYGADFTKIFEEKIEIHIDETTEEEVLESEESNSDIIKETENTTDSEVTE